MATEPGPTTASGDSPGNASKPVSILFVGDIVGGIGRRTLLGLLPGLRERLAPDFVVVNGENAAGGLGITPKIAEALFAAGIDVITLGNHTYRHREIYPSLDAEPRILRPANFLRSQPGHGSCVVTSGGVRLAVLSLSGNLYMNAGRPAFAEADAAVRALQGQADHMLVDMHAEATSEKVGMGWYLDGRVTAVVGTHTHVTTADERVLPQGTAFITDVGMTGPHDGVIGMDRNAIVKRFLDGLPTRFDVAGGDVQMNCVLIETDDEGPRNAAGRFRARSIERLRFRID